MENTEDLNDDELSVLIKKVLNEELIRNNIPKKIIECLHELGIDFKKNGKDSLTSCITNANEVLKTKKMPTDILIGMMCTQEMSKINSNFTGIDLYRCIYNKSI
jgi:hypothetical protein